MLAARYWRPSLVSSHDALGGAGGGEGLFNVDICGGLPALIVEMLVQSSVGTVRLLPACPPEWGVGAHRGHRVPRSGPGRAAELGAGPRSGRVAVSEGDFAHTRPAGSIQGGARRRTVGRSRWRGQRPGGGCGWERPAGAFGADTHDGDDGGSLVGGRGAKSGRGIRRALSLAAVRSVPGPPGPFDRRVGGNGMERPALGPSPQVRHGGGGRFSVLLKQRRTSLVFDGPYELPDFLTRIRSDWGQRIRREANKSDCHQWVPVFPQPFQALYRTTLTEEPAFLAHAMTCDERITMLSWCLSLTRVLEPQLGRTTTPGVTEASVPIARGPWVEPITNPVDNCLREATMAALRPTDTRAGRSRRLWPMPVTMVGRSSRAGAVRPTPGA